MDLLISTIPATNCTPQTIVIGRRGTYNTQQIDFDLSYLIESYGAGVAALMVMRSQDETAYPAVASQDGTTLTWTISEIDTYYVGSGEVQLMWYVDGGLAKTIIYPMVVMRDILQTTEEPPDPYQTWVDDLLTLGAETLQNAQDAAQSASEAGQSATDAGAAKTAAENAQTAAETAQGLAEDAKTAAETAQGKAETAQGKAETAQEKAETAQTAAEAAADRAEDALEEFTTPTASATTLDPDDDATASYANGHFTFGIPKGDVGSTPDFSIGSVETLQPSQPATASITGTLENPVLNLGIPQGKQGDPATNLVQSVNGKTGAVVLDSGDIAYESTTVESELGTINSALTSLQSVTEIIDTASGAIASFPDGAGLPMRSLVAQINPVQDLHGQDAPWPAGGSAQMIPDGTNTNNGYEDGKILMDDGTYVNNSDAYISEYFPVTAGASYLYSSKTTLFSPAVCFYDSSKTFISGIKPNGVNPKTMVAPEGAAYARATQYKAGYSNMTQFEAGTTATAIKPYSNICPISGWTGLSGWRRGGNVIDWTYGQSQTSSGITSAGVVDDCKAVFNGTATATIGFTLGRKAVKNGETYTLTVKGVDSTHTINCRAIKGDLASGGEYISMVKNFNSDGSYTFTCDGTYNIVDFRPTFISGAVCNNYEMFFAITGGTNPASFEPVNSEPISVSFGRTVYGGSDEVIGGNGTSTMGKIVFDGTQSILGTNWQAKEDSVAWIYAYTLTNHAFSTSLDDKPNFLADKCPVVTAREVVVGNSPQLLEVGCYNASSIGIIFRTTDMTLTTESAINAYLAENPVTLVYELATPTTFTHEGQSVDTLVGQNNVFVDCGSVSVTYQASIKGYIDKVLAS